jgi:hypothetical protein
LNAPAVLNAITGAKNPGFWSLWIERKGGGEGLMKRIIAIAILVIVGIYTEAQLVSTKHALWEIKAALQGNTRIVILQQNERQKRSPTIPVGYEE